MSSRAKLYNNYLFWERLNRFYLPKWRGESKCEFKTHLIVYAVGWIYGLYGVPFLNWCPACCHVFHANCKAFLCFISHVFIAVWHCCSFQDYICAPPAFLWLLGLLLRLVASQAPVLQRLVKPATSLLCNTSSRLLSDNLMLMRCRSAASGYGHWHRTIVSFYAFRVPLRCFWLKF